MYSDEEIAEMLDRNLANRGLRAAGWTFEFVDSGTLGGKSGFANQDAKTIEINLDHFPTADRNVKELVLHEIAHALCGHGRHDLEWWDKLIDIGGHGVWLHDDGELTQVRIES